MIERIRLKEVLSFSGVELTPCAGLNIFSGPSGAGKSVLFGAILALFGVKESDAALAEATLTQIKLNGDFVLENDDEIVVKQIKKEKARFFINDSQIGKNALRNAFSETVRYLNHKEISDISSNNLLQLLDFLANTSSKTHIEMVAKFKTDYQVYIDDIDHLEELKTKESKAQELIEFARFEIAKIEAIAPKNGEYEQLMELKKRLSKKEKIAESITAANDFLELSSAVYTLYDLIGVDKTQLNEAINELSAVIENTQEELNDAGDPEAMLERIEKLSSLIRRYDSIENALASVQQKKVELAQFESIEDDIKQLERSIQKQKNELEKTAETIQKNRKKAKKPLDETVSQYLKSLFLPNCNLELETVELNSDAGVRAKLMLNGVAIEKISAGEFNRMRLALLAARVQLNDRADHAILFLDEIDANVSGEEAASIAKTLKLLSKNYQIFAISHHSQLTAKADQHYLVIKNGEKSEVKQLNTDERINEIARIISSDHITSAALEHAKKLLEE